MKQVRKVNTGAAARRITAHLRREAGGVLPVSAAGWHALAALMGLHVAALTAVPPEFTARLIRDDRLSEGWLIVYSVAGSPVQVCRWIAHELAEYLAVQDYPSLFDGLPQRVYCYTGGSDPTDARHRIARAVEGLCFRRA